MAKTSAERVKEYRERQRQAARKALLEPVPEPGYVVTPFYAFMDGRHVDFEENLDAYGVHISGTDLGEAVQKFDTEAPWEKSFTSLERARGMMGVFLDAAKELAALINEYKLQEVGAAIDAAHEVSASLPRGDVEALKKSFAEIERLRAIQSELRKPTRHTLLSVDATGE
ncbi:hypothetical protein [Pseudorhizobium pelagicum]|uniref:Uncharacterized protein n=1 Tax=Pseudorhizobium pelagicum TaxID=1509405 RepID=A0A922P3M8_9HYPH|nr:hypothetical protein [Pseudorhizobium pelagicum]KEQ08054.1 hypothetical protein GV67_17855 [Pseudorhizobium pelagicum]KEQ10251.1 hypothetical protein GV68_15125 [Pseudorhizobium pelagicum]